MMQNAIDMYLNRHVYTVYTPCDGKSEMLMAPCNSKGIDSLACCIEFAGSKWLKAPYPRAGKRGVPYGQTRIQYQRNYLARKTDVHYVHHEYS